MKNLIYIKISSIYLALRKFCFLSQWSAKMSLPKFNLSSKVLILLSVCLLSFTITVATGHNFTGNYNPPTDAEEVDQNTTVSSGSRSTCPSVLPEGSLAMLLPKQEIAHQTISGNPSLYVYAKQASPVPLETNLIIPEAYVENPLFKKSLTIEKPGIYKIEVPPSLELEYDKIHLWQIGIPCSNNTGKLNQVLRGAIKRVHISKELAYQLSLASTPLAKAKAYAESGIWYDALDSAQETQNSPEVAKYKQDLLQNVQVSLIF